MQLWLIFIAVIVCLLIIDLNIKYDNGSTVSIKKAVFVTSVWVSISLLFGVFIYFAYNHHWFGIGLHIGHNTDGKEAFLQYITGYLIEESLSFDNIFVISIIFTYFKIKAIYQRRLLFIGILTAMVLRGLVIIGGAYLMNKYSWVTYIFGGFLIISAFKMLKSHDSDNDLKDSALYRFITKLLPATDQVRGKRFFVRFRGRWLATPLLLALIIIELADVMFAFDSIPAIFAITTDPFIVFTSNIFAILGLRSLYFVLIGFLDKFKNIKYSLIVILAFVGVKLICSVFFHIPPLISLLVIVCVLAVGVLSSIMSERRDSTGQS